MMRVWRYLLLVIIAGIASQVSAAEGIECALEVYQRDTIWQKNVLLYTDTVQIVRDVPTSGFLIAFSTEIHLTDIDTNNASFTVHLVTLGPPAQTYARNFTVEYGLPVRIEGIAIKQKAQYALVITPLSKIEIDTSTCAFNHRAEGVFRSDPSANMDIYFVPNSLGDFYWNAIKDLFEKQYRVFRDLFHLNLPGKYNIYLCPCPLYSVLWDDRFGMAINPTRSTAFAIYSKQGNSADPFLVIHTAVLRTFGYAPPFLSEGWANYVSFALFEMKQLLQEDKNRSVVPLLDTYAYFQADPYVADRISATFVRYLIDRYGPDRFKKLYEQANDLNLREKIEAVYEQSVSNLETEWRHYVDTVTISPDLYAVFTHLAEQMLDYPRMLRYAKGYVDHAANAQDSIAALGLLKRAYFFTGDYYKATETQAALLTLEPTPRNWMTLAAYKMINGYYDDARADLLKALALDSTDQMVRFNLAYNYLLSGDEEEGKERLLDVIVNPGPRGSVGGEARILLADLLQKSKDSLDRALANTYFNEAAQVYEQQLQTHQASPSTHLWLGIAYLGLGDTGNASDHLQTALFLETRPFYLGMINLWLGKVADVLQDRTAARKFYERVLALPSAHYHQTEARTYLDTPYRQ
jgi:Flp pilus assembly protein TadD